MIKANIGKTIRSYRTDAHLTQDELARRIGVSRPTISSWEIDRTEPAIQDVERMARVFGCTTDDILGDYPDRLIKDRDIQVMIRLAEQLTKEQRKSMIEQMEYTVWKNKEKNTPRTEIS